MRIRRHLVDLRTRVPRGAVLIAGTLALTGCASGSSTQALKERLVGLPARGLSTCLGVPISIDVDGETEYLTYRWFDQGQDDFRSPLDPRVRGGVSQRAPRYPTDVDEKPDMNTSFCELVFEIQEGRVSAVEVDSNRASGLRDDYGCLRNARNCIPDE